MYKILVTDPISDKGLAILTDAGLEMVYEPALSPEALNEAVADVHGWVIRSGTTITADHLAMAKNLQVIGRAGVGVDNIDIQEATNRGIVVMNIPDGNTISAAEHTIAMMMAIKGGSRDIHNGIGSVLCSNMKFPWLMERTSSWFSNTCSKEPTPLLNRTWRRVPLILKSTVLSGTVNLFFKDEDISILIWY